MGMTIIESIYAEPERWRLESEYRFRHESGAALWIANGVWFLSPDPGGSFDFITKVRAWLAFKWWQRNAPVEAFGKRT